MMPQQTRRLPGSEDDLDANHLSQMELGFPGQRPESEPDMMVFTPTDSPTTEKVPALPQPSANQDSRTRERSVTIATAITLDLRNASPTPSSHSQFDKPTSAFNSSSPEIKRSSGGDFQSQPNTSLSALPTTLSSPISPDLASAPMGQVSSSISPFAKYDPAIDPSSSHSRFASTTYDNTASEEAYFANFALPSLGTRPPRRPRCSRTLGTVIADMTPRGPKALVERVRVKILGLRDEDEFSGKDYTRPGPFAPMTPIESAIIRRSNWEVIAKSVIIASILTAVLAGSLYTVPVKHH
ncbi:hypothetical protein FRB99_007121 [Tulasnella sp. 403]|nr:hypothetical protein FRB99_007121 [Tulasnella sp. 403]